MVRNAVVLLPALLAALALGACGKGDSKKPATQVAAKVNSEEISVHQVNRVIERVARGDPGRAVPAQVLERIIDEELIVQKAREAKLDRDPRVVQAIQDSRRHILVQAYVDKAIGSARSTPEEIKAFYVQNPALFERRRVYRFLEVVAAVPEEKLDSLKAQVARAKTLNDVSAWFRSQGLAYNFATWTKPAEQLPRGYPVHFADLRDGQMAVLPSATGGTSVIQVIQSKDAPLSEQQAKPIIERALAMRKGAEHAEADLKRLREKASIEYVGNFKAASQDAPPAAVQAAVPAAGPAGHMEKGISSLR
jgi:EpsD family peptidyl-prolyl cis-trans isomerase